MPLVATTHTSAKPLKRQEETKVSLLTYLVMCFVHKIQIKRYAKLTSFMFFFLFLCSCQIELEYHPSASDLYLLASFYIRNICLLIMTPRETRSFVLRSLPPPPLLYINARPWRDSLLLNATHPERTGRTQTGAECRRSKRKERTV